MNEVTEPQVFIRNDRGQVWGPLQLSTVSLLLENRMVEGRIEVSKDGIHFSPPALLPDIRDAFPRELWGEAPAPPAAQAAVPRPAPGKLPSSGQLSEVSPLRLYCEAAAAELTGMLALQLPDRAFEIHFRKGNPEYVSSSHPEDSVAAFLLKRNLAKPEQLNQAEAARGRFGGELIAAIFGLGILDPATAFVHFVHRAQSLLLKAMRSDRGTFSFEPKELLAHRAMPLGNRWAILGEIVRRIPYPEVQRRLQGAADLPIIKSSARVPLAEVRLNPQEMRALRCLDGVRSLSQLRQGLPPQDTETLSRVVLLLMESGLASFAAARVPPRPAAVPAAAPAPAPQAPPRPAAPQPAPRPAPATPAPESQGFEAQLAEMRQVAASLKGKNHFEVLGLTEKADPGATKMAYFKLARMYHPDTVPPGAPPELAKLKGDIFSAVGEAYRTLSDEKSRARYLEELKHGAQQVDVAKLLRAEELFQKGCALVKMRKFADAVKMLDEAIQSNPDEGEFYAWRGIARFFTFQDRKQGYPEAMKDITACLQRNERCAPAHYFQGQMAKLLGDNAAALRHFTRTVELQPNHVDAQRELRLLGGKR